MKTEKKKRFHTETLQRHWLIHRKLVLITRPYHTRKEIQNPYTVYGSPFTTTTGYPDKESATATLDLNTGVCTILGTNQVGVPVNTPRSFGEK